MSTSTRTQALPTITQQHLNTFFATNVIALQSRSKVAGNSFSEQQTRDYDTRLITISNSILQQLAEQAAQGMILVQGSIESQGEFPKQVTEYLFRDITQIIIEFHIKPPPQAIWKYLPSSWQATSQKIAYAASWKLGNTFLYELSKPTFPPPKKDTLRDHFQQLFKQAQLTDVTVQVDTLSVRCHGVLLAQSPVFMQTLMAKEIVGPLNRDASSLFHIKKTSDNNSQTLLLLEQNSPDTRRLLTHFHVTCKTVVEWLYSGKLSDTYSTNFDRCLEIFQLADFLKLEALKNIAKYHLYQITDESTFLKLVSVLERQSDPDLQNLCGWFFSNSRWATNI